MVVLLQNGAGQDPRALVARGLGGGCRAWASGKCACSSGRCGPRPGTTPLDARGLPALDLRQEVGEVF